MTDLSSGLQHSVDLTVDTLEGWSVDSCLNSVNYGISSQLHEIRSVEEHTSVKAVLSELLPNLHKVPLCKIDLLGQTSLSGLLVRPLNLKIVVVQSSDVGISESTNFTSGSADTASNVQYSHVGFDADLVGKVVLVSGELIISVIPRIIRDNNVRIEGDLLP